MKPDRPCSPGGLYYKNSLGNEIRVDGGSAGSCNTPWGQSGSNIYYHQGNVGIGTTNPGATLDIEGDIAIGSNKYLTSRFTMYNPNWVSGDVAFIVSGPGTSAEGAFALHFWDPADSTKENRFVMNIGDDKGTKIWADDSGRLRTRHSWGIPTNTTDGTVIGDQTSSLDRKDLIGEFTDYENALNDILETPLYRFTYKDGAYNKEEFVGVVTDYSPMFGKDRDIEHPGGKSFNEITAIGYAFAAIKALKAELDTKVIKQNNGNVSIGTKSPLYAPHIKDILFVSGTADALFGHRHLKNIGDFSFDAIDILKELHTVTFEWKEAQDSSMEGSQFGFMAKEAEEALPDALLTRDSEEKKKGLKYNALISVLVEAVKMQQKQLEEKQAQIEELMARVSALEAGRASRDSSQLSFSISESRKWKKKWQIWRQGSMPPSTNKRSTNKRDVVNQLDK